ncbi:thiamin pyrophosphokinase 1 [Tetranychus urticae]|uniref:thiamin pyrophosphokinase 1 n=1 Tax=Tetranychus urticae TaxID=32264 RepID=UPI00077BF0C3|nr:thiamin pyrophosphokinase 1 [Tetranychus urticae]
MAFKFESDTYHWQSNLISGKGDQNFGLVILNHALDDLDSNQLDNFNNLWQSAKLKLSVDGGTNSLIDLGPTYVPDLITGDFDSIKESTTNYFKKLGVEIIETPDQNYTDFMKALFVLDEKHMRNQLNYIVVLWQVNHRLDQSFSNISTLHKWSEEKSDCPIFYLDLKGSLSWLMKKGRHEIVSNSQPKWLSIVPFDGPATITSSGLLYNMNKMTLSFSSILSTSNQFAKSDEKAILEVEDNPVLWSQHYCPT